MAAANESQSFAGILPDDEFVAVVVTARVKADRTGVVVDVPAVLTSRGVVLPLLDFCCDNRESRSLDWLEKLCRACCQFLEFAAAHRGMSDREILDAFALRRYTGTFAVDTGFDPSWLCWRPVSREAAKRTLSQLETFFGSFDEVRRLIRPLTAAYDLALEQAAYSHARERAFLGHTWSVKSKRTSSFFSASLPKTINPQDGEKPAFPEDRFMDLLLRGWNVNGRPSYRDMLITLLLNGGGVRLSEVFHLYVTDILPSRLEPGSTLVLFHHPTEGAAPEDWLDPRGGTTTGNRRAYLKERWGLEPRTLQRGASHAGWKGAAMSRDFGSKAFQVHWFMPQLGVIFQHIWNRYLADLVFLPRRHPYAFVNVRRGEPGDIYKASAFRTAHREAVRRIGLVPSRVQGTEPHGHRHAYGTRLHRAGVPGESIQRFLHHLSFESHLVYTHPFQLEVVETLGRAAANLGTDEVRRWNQCVDEVEYRIRKS